MNEITTGAPIPANPLLDRIKMPGETFTLPSGGLFYTNNELDSSAINAEVHVHPMTAIDEILLKTPDLLFSGQAISQVFRHCIPQINKPMELMAKDVDFLLICLRKVSFGEMMELEYEHNCKDAKLHHYNVNIDTFVKGSVRIEPVNYKSKYQVILDNKQVVNMNPIRFKDYIRIMQSAEGGSLSAEQVKVEMIESLTNVIRSVDEVTNPEHIAQWLESIKAGWLQAITDHIEVMSDWGPTFKTEIVCKDCDAQVMITPPMNPIAFFT